MITRKYVIPYIIEDEGEVKEGEIRTQAFDEEHAAEIADAVGKKSGKQVVFDTPKLDV